MLLFHRYLLFIDEVKKMLVKLIFDAQFCGKHTWIVNVPNNSTANYIKNVVFPKETGIEFDENCDYEILDE